MHRDSSPWAHLRPEAVEKQLWFYAIDATMRTEDQLDALLAQMTPGIIEHPQLEKGFALVRSMRERGAVVDSTLVMHEVLRRNIVIDDLDPIDVSRSSCWSAVVPHYLEILEEARRGRALAGILKRATDALKAGMPAGAVAGHVNRTLDEAGLT